MNAYLVELSLKSFVLKFADLLSMPRLPPVPEETTIPSDDALYRSGMPVDSYNPQGYIAGNPNTSTVTMPTSQMSIHGICLSSHFWESLLGKGGLNLFCFKVRVTILSWCRSLRKRKARRCECTITAGCSLRRTCLIISSTRPKCSRRSRRTPSSRARRGPSPSCTATCTSPRRPRFSTWTRPRLPASRTRATISTMRVINMCY